MATSSSNPLNNIPKNKITPELLAFLESSGAKEMAATLAERLTSNTTEKYLNSFITDHPLMNRLKAYTRKLASVNEPILILGETGTGKELIANALHGDREGKFIPVNCAGIPETLLESELFGHKKGSFTGAYNDRIGICINAECGTIFLDEIGDLPLSIQGKLLRAVQEKRIRPIGASEEIEISCHFVFATHRDLKRLVKEGLFREDLFWRISTFVLLTMPIRERLRDIPLLVQHFDTDKCIKDYEDFISKIDTNRLSGNVRSIQQIVKRYCVLGTMPHE